MKVVDTYLGFKEWTRVSIRKGRKGIPARGNETGRGVALKCILCMCLENGPNSETSEAEGHLLLSSGSRNWKI